MNVGLAIAVAVCSVAAYVYLSAELLSAHTAFDPLGRSQQANGMRRDRRWLLVEVPLAIFVISMTHLLLVGVAFNGAEATGARWVCGIGLALSLAWTGYVALGILKHRRS